MLYEVITGIGKDSVEFSSVLQDVHKAQSTQAGSSSERAEKVLALKAQVSEGSYQPDLNKVASSLLQFLIVITSYSIHYTKLYDLSAGPLIETDNPLDAAIHGEGFFKVMGPNGVRYTRRGDFVIDQNNILRTRSGLSVLDDANGEITIADAQTGRVSINQQGGITLITADGGEAAVRNNFV